MDTRQTHIEKSPQYYRKAVQKTRRKHREEDPERYKRAQEETRKRQMDIDPNYYNKAMQTSREKQEANVDEKARRLNFNLAILFGPIFICSCCERRLFENGVKKITNNFKDKVNGKNPQVPHFEWKE